MSCVLQIVLIDGIVYDSKKITFIVPNKEFKLLWLLRFPVSPFLSQGHAPAFPAGFLALSPFHMRIF
jgi:hypothetical protein